MGGSSAPKGVQAQPRTHLSHAPLPYLAFGLDDGDDRAIRGARRVVSLLQFVVIALAWFSPTGSARADAWRFRARASAGFGVMVSKDQLGTLAYDKPGILADAHAGYALQDWLDLQVGVMTGTFFSVHRETGAVFAPLLGARFGLPIETARPYLMVDGGPAFTGPFLRPVLRAAIGVDTRLNRAFMMGPFLGFGHIMQWRGPQYSTSAQYLWLGIAITYQPVVPRKPRPKPAKPKPEPAPPPSRALPPPAPVPVEPSPEILALLERTLPNRDELLAPVLFEFDSDALEPQGIAMLHEVAQALKLRPQIRRIEIRGYADSRGSTAYNRDLSARRAERVRAWLVEHGIEPDRLQTAAIGASDFVELGASEPEHLQNRRVVFRILEVGEP